MTFSDYTIVYLSAGSPFAVFVFLQNADGSLIRRLARGAAALIVWPVVVAAAIYRRFRGTGRLRGSETAEQILDRRIREIEYSLEETIRRNGAAISIHEWRDTFERYAGLSKAIAGAENLSEENELFVIAGNKNGKLGTACLNRRNRSRLIFHHTKARNDFLDALVRIGRDRDSLDLSIELATLFRDADALADLTAMRVRAEQKTGKSPVIDMEQEVWNPPTPKPHIANRI